MKNQSKPGYASIDDVLNYSAYKGTIKEMQMRMILSEIRKAADKGEDEVIIPLYKLTALHMPTLINKILKGAGFQAYETVTTTTELELELKAIYISWMMII